jgi:hypothetical protein
MLWGTFPLSRSYIHIDIPVVSLQDIDYFQCVIVLKLHVFAQIRGKKCEGADKSQTEPQAGIEPNQSKDRAMHEGDNPSF